ncbi:MAG: T9SS C-terminal target domain-containing protein [Gemmatimonadetes bacterium]|nr:MAG: T9SS C-terminal target domain-containing protein [Gemmatimonadota bacterium]
MTLTVTDNDGATDSDQATVTVNAVGGGGGSFTTLFDDFESGWGNWNDGGSDCARYSGSRSYGGSYSIRIRDNSGTASSMTTDAFDASGVSSIDVEFFFYSYSMENGEDFWLQYSSNGGSTWTTVASWARGTHFNNNTFYTATVSINTGNSSNAKVRFRCDASANADHIYIDDVTIRASAGARLAGNSLVELGSIPGSDALAGIDEIAVPQNVTLGQNYPNPFNPRTSIPYEISTDTHVTLNIYDLSGRLVRSLVDEYLAPGKYSVNWNGVDNKGQSVESGVYIYHLTTNEHSITRTMTLLK